MAIFYQPDIPEGINYLDETESHHCTKVLRLKSGDSVELTDGRGGWYHAVLVDSKPKKTTFSITQTVIEKQKEPCIHLAVAPTKNTDRYEWFIEKAVEIGVSEITPLLCEHSERTKIRGDRLDKIAVSAIKQSKKAFLPKINQPVRFSELVSATSEQSKFIAYCEEIQNSLSAESIRNTGSVIVLIGPEGDFSVDEVKLAGENNFKSISLGNSRLRTETAAIVSCCILNFLCNP